MNAKLVIFSIIGLVGFITLLALTPFTVVSPGHRGVVTNIGTVSDEVLGEGFHWVNPFDSVTEISVQTTKVEATASAASKDLQTVVAKVAINYHLDPTLVTKLYQNVKGDYEVTIVAPAIQDSVKAATAFFTAEELITKRAAVSTEIETYLAARLEPYGLLESVSITNFEFSESFNNAIELKVTAEQNALAAKNLLAQKEYEAQQILVTAKADAEAMRIKSAALSESSNLVELEWVNKWDGKLPSTVMGDTIPMVNIK
jgi:prohibitin 2